MHSFAFMLSTRVAQTSTQVPNVTSENLTYSIIFLHHDIKVTELIRETKITFCKKRLIFINYVRRQVTPFTEKKRGTREDTLYSKAIYIFWCLHFWVSKVGASKGPVLKKGREAGFGKKSS